MRKIILSFLLISVSVILFSNWPVSWDSKELISDVFWSWRGDSLENVKQFHYAVDIASERAGDSVFSTNMGIVYWLEKDKGYQNFVGIGVYGNDAIFYGHVSAISDILLRDTISSKGEYIGKIIHQYPHVNMDYAVNVVDTINSTTINLANKLKDPMLYLNRTYPMNLQIPQFYWLDTNDIGDESKIGRFIAKKYSKVFDNIENQPAIVYGGVQLQVAPASFSGVWCNYYDSLNTYQENIEVSRDSLFSEKEFYSFGNRPKMSFIYNLNFSVNEGNRFKQINADLWNDADRLRFINDYNGVFGNVWDGFAPFKTYIFTNKDTVDGGPQCATDVYWSTNMKEGIEGFYVNIMEDTAEVAKSNLEAKYKDGLNWVHLYASSYSTENINEMGRDSVPVILDNFSPAADTEMSVVKTPREEENIVGVIDIEPYDIIELKLQMTEMMDVSEYSGGMYYYTGSKIYLDTVNFKKISLT